MARPAALGAALAIVLAGTAACSDDSLSRDESGAITEAGDLSVFELRVGDCLDPPADLDSELGTVTAKPCDQPHTQEVFAVIDSEDETFPGAEEIEDFAEAECVDRFADYVGTDYADSSLFFTFLVPSLRSWDQKKDRAVVCVITTTGNELTESVQGSEL